VQPATELAAFAAGFAVAEGSFVHDVRRRRFVFSVGLGATDIVTCELLRDFFGVGALVHHARRKPHYDDEVTFVVRRLRDLVEVVVPFMDEHLPPSYKREQYVAWRAALLEHWEHHARRVRPCTVAGCERPRRAKGLCRHHYYEAFGR
jgi:hypothetical protein